MQKELFSVFDKKTNIWSDPYPYIKKGEAIRAFQGTANDKNSQIGVYPEDFELYHIGTMNNEPIKIVTLPEPVYVIGAKDLLK